MIARCADGVPPGQAVADRHFARQAKILRPQHFVRRGIGQHGFGVDPRLVDERARARDVVVEGDVQPADVRDQPVDLGQQRQVILCPHRRG